MWRDDTRHYPSLELPHSSLDLLIPPSSMLLDALSVYESLRFFTQPLKVRSFRRKAFSPKFVNVEIQLTPFRFEDFCACLVYSEHNNLLSHIFCAILKTLYKSDDRQVRHVILSLCVTYCHPRESRTARQICATVPIPSTALSTPSRGRTPSRSMLIATPNILAKFKI